LRWIMQRPGKPTALPWVATEFENSVKC
jgi:hypothetical protein